MTAVVADIYVDIYADVLHAVHDAPYLMAGLTAVTYADVPHAVQDAQAEYGESKEHNKGAAKGHAVSALDEAKAGMEHAKEAVTSKFTKNKAEAADKVCRGTQAMP